MCFLHDPVRIFDNVPRHGGNARYYQCMLDEDMIRRAPWQVQYNFGVLKFAISEVCLCDLLKDTPGQVVLIQTHSDLRLKAYARDFIQMFSPRGASNIIASVFA